MQVEESWNGTEFTVLPYRDSKDVFILGGTDDIQVLLDDSLVSDTNLLCMYWNHEMELAENSEITSSFNLISDFCFAKGESREPACQFSMQANLIA